MLNLEKRSREYLTVAEVNELIMAAKSLGRHGDRDSLMVLIMYRHALTVCELVDLSWDQMDLSWDQMDLNRGWMHVNRLNNGDSSVHYLEGDKIRALRKLRRDYPQTDFVFESERQGPLTPNAVYKIVARAGVEAGLELTVHPHMLNLMAKAISSLQKESIQGLYMPTWGIKTSSLRSTQSKTF